MKIVNRTPYKVTKVKYTVKAYTGKGKLIGQKAETKNLKISAGSSYTLTVTIPKSKLKKKSSAYGAYYRAKIKWKKVSGATSYKLYYRASGSSYKYLYKEYKGTSATVQFYKSKYSNTSLKYTFYVVPVKKYEGKSYTGSYSKGKTYKFK